MLSQGQAITLEFKALKCLRQAEDNADYLGVASAFARRAAKFLHREKCFIEASAIAKKLLTITQTNAI